MYRKSVLVILVGMFTASMASAQFGISARIQNNTNKTWTNTYESAADTMQNLFSRSYEFGINYWFRLKDYRVEFLPELSMAVSEESPLFSELFAESHKRQSYYFNFNVQVYPLDFIGDCNCPTFSKDGNFVAKGFYWLFSPGISYHVMQTTNDPISSFVPEDESITSVRLGLGAGIDIGVTDMFTFSPFILYSMNFGNSWKSQYDAYNLTLPEGENNSANIKQWHIGARIIFRPDYNN